MGTRLLNLNSVLLGAGRGGYQKNPLPSLLSPFFLVNAKFFIFNERIIVYYILSLILTYHVNRQ